MQLRDVMTKDPEYVSPTTTLDQVAQMMRDHDIGMVLVADKDELIGTVTDRDIVIRAIAEGRDPRTIGADAVMTTNAAYCFEDQGVDEAARVMETRQIRRLAILSREKRLVGVVSLGDLAVKSGDEARSGEVMKHVARPAA
jgi:CBS domain-containing protein